MIDIIFFHVFHFKIVHHQGETDCSGLMPLQTWRVDTFVISEWHQLSAEALMCNARVSPHTACLI